MPIAFETNLRRTISIEELVFCPNYNLIQNFLFNDFWRRLGNSIEVFQSRHCADA